MLSHPGDAQSSIVRSFCPPSWLLLPPHTSNRLIRGSGLSAGLTLHFTMAFIAKSFYDLSAISLDGEKVDFNTFRGRAVLIENVASL